LYGKHLLPPTFPRKSFVNVLGAPGVQGLLGNARVEDTQAEPVAGVDKNVRFVMVVLVVSSFD
jgi:hypothetical protein